MRKIIQAMLCILVASGALSGCNTIPTNTAASACEQGIEKLSARLSATSYQVNQVSISRANSLLLAAQVQHQFAEYPGCIEKVQRAQDYLAGSQTAIISRLSI